MTAIEALECRIDELCRENEQLRQQVASIIGRSFRTADKMDCLATENAKLRELVRNVEHYERLGCHECPYADGCEAHTLYDEECPMSREIERIKRELGFEVS